MSDEQRENDEEAVERRTTLHREEDQYLIERTVRRDEVLFEEMTAVDLFHCTTRPIIILLFAFDLLYTFTYFAHFCSS